MIFENGLTIAELKEYVKDLPEYDDNGEPFEVWLGNDKGTSNVCAEIFPLNKKKSGSDIIMDCL